VGILQVPPRLLNGETLWGRLQHFADQLYGPMLASGLSAWSGGDGIYWGHNAIIRLSAFAAHCALPTLPGRPPLGGEVLSHDFVEAALMRRAGWEVRVADDLEGSYEEAPPTLVESLQRDRRWCQGNLQHITLLSLRELHPLSFYHFAAGIMSYLTAPLLAIFIGAGIVVAYRQLHRPIRYFFGSDPLPNWPLNPQPYAIALFALTLTLLFLPRLLRLMMGLAVADDRRRFGGPMALTVSFLIELAASLLISPVVMLFHTSFVIEILVGRSVGWKTQRRTGGPPTGQVVRRFAMPTIVGVVAATFAWLKLGAVFWFLMPLFAGPVLAIPVALVTASRAPARWLKRWNLLVTAMDKTGSVLTGPLAAAHH